MATRPKGGSLREYRGRRAFLKGHVGRPYVLARTDPESLDGGFVAHLVGLQQELGAVAAWSSISEPFSGYSVLEVEILGS